MNASQAASLTIEQRLVILEAKVNQAQRETQEAKAHAQKAEMRTQKAEARADVAEKQLQQLTVRATASEQMVQETDKKNDRTDGKGSCT
ncbi:carbohydrate porin [Citrobacter amalonaticus]|nr:carbohydrate porin [Citrobacter amalonaticus]